MLEDLENKLKSLGFEESPQTWLFNTILFSFLIAMLVVLAVYFAFYLTTPTTFDQVLCLLIVFISVSLFLIGISIANVYSASDQMKRRVESLLPDFLFLVSSNLRAKMSPMLALKTAAREEFGPLSEEINYVTTKSLGTSSFAEQLIKIPNRVASELVERVMMLFITGYVTGGNLAQILEQLGRDIREIEQLKTRLYLGVNVYVLFIMISLLVGMPLLFAATKQFIAMSISVSQSTSLPPVSAIDVLFIFMLAATSILTGLFSATIKGEVSYTGLLRGLVYALVTVFLFLVFSYLLNISLI